LITPPTILLAASLAQKPHRGGHTWVILQYLLGLRRLGWDVLFLDQLAPAMCVDDAGQPCSLDRSANLRYLMEVMERFGLGDAFALIYNRGERWVGRSRQEVLGRATGAAMLLNIMGFLDHEEVLERVPRRVFLDIDPGFGQIWRELGLSDPFRGHDAYVTIGQSIGQPDCTIPTCGLEWITTPQPIVLEHWPPVTHPADKITSVGSWRGAYGPLEYRGATYGLRVHEFRKFIELPRMSEQRFELALDIHPNEARDLALLAANDWALVDPRVVAGDPWIYRDYIQRSWAELMVAKNMYVRSKGGWFSDRSICYLASGRPVLAQDTGIAGHYPHGEGLLCFTTPEEALAGVETIACDYQRHARAARAIAEEYFDSDTVLSRLLGKLGV
jgi:hypothetical protein